MAEASFGSGFGGNAAENYERFFVFSIGEPLARDLIAFAALRPGERVLDVACGTGIVARLAAERVGGGGFVAGLDLNPAMLSVARSAARKGAAIEWHEASAEAMPLPPDSFDAVLCQLSLQFFSDKLAALREMRRVLVPGGRLAVSVPGTIQPLFAAMDETLARHIGPQASTFVRAVFSLHDPAELRDLLSSAGFREVAVRPETKRFSLPPPGEFLWQYALSTPLEPLVTQADANRRAAIEREFVEECRGMVDDGVLRLDQPIVVGTARKEG